MARSMHGLLRIVAREGTRDARILDALRTLDRADFAPPGAGHEVYDDRPVVLPEGQTTSQPSLIARMVEAAHPGPDDKVLEIGTGYGFQTALLARLAAEVVSIERHPSLAEAARRNLERVGISNARVVVGDGWEGAPDEGPFDAVVVSAAADTVPQALADGLVEGGRLVIPVRSSLSDDVVLYERKGDGLERVRLVTPARFVPLVPGMPEA